MSAALIIGLLLACALVPVAAIVLQWREAARKSDKWALQIFALHEGPRACWCKNCKQARRVLGLPAETPRWPELLIVWRGGRRPPPTSLPGPGSPTRY